MSTIKKGDIVGRKSYGKDIIFKVSHIIKRPNGNIAILNGIVERIIADSEVSDLEIIKKQVIKEKIKNLDDILEYRVEEKTEEKENREYKIGIITNNKKAKEKMISGKILHLDGDRKYSEKSYRYYKKLGLNAIVKNIPEYRQPKVVYRLLEIYKPDILVVTGHDGMLKRGTRIL